MIHPTAIVSPEAEIAPDAEVGPYAVVEGPARIGPRCRILAHAIIKGDVVLGADNLVDHHAVIGGWPQDLAFRPETPSGVTVGERNVFRENVTIHRGTSPGSRTVVGDDNFLMAGAHLAHNVRLGNRNILANNVLLGGHVEFGDRVFAGGAALFHQFVRVGSLAIIQGAGGFSKDVPPYALGAEHNTLFGLNVIGLRRAGFSAETRAEIQELYRILFRSGKPLADALAEASARAWGPEAAAVVTFVAASKKGIAAHARRRAAAD
jgi:UDP-N-acetylglucosamine acyltransferase